MWFDIIKAKLINVQHTGVKVTKPKVEDIEEGPCNRKLKEYANKLKGIQMYFEQIWERHQVELKEQGGEKTDGKEFRKKHWDKNHAGFDTVETAYNKSFGIRLAGKHDVYKGWEVNEDIVFNYWPIPEEVACRALDMLHKNETSEDTLKLPRMRERRTGEHVMGITKDDEWVIKVFKPPHRDNQISLRIGRYPFSIDHVHLRHYRDYHISKMSRSNETDGSRHSIREAFKILLHSQRTAGLWTEGTDWR